MNFGRKARVIGVVLIICGTIAAWLLFSGNKGVEDQFTVNFSRYENDGQTVVLLVTNRSTVDVDVHSGLSTTWQIPSGASLVKRKSNKEIRLYCVNFGSPILQANLLCVSKLDPPLAKLYELSQRFVGVRVRDRLFRIKYWRAPVTLPSIVASTNRVSLHETR